MGDEVIALKDKAHCVVAVRVPVAVGVFLGGHAVDDKVALVVAVKAADDVQEGRFARAALSEDRDKFAVPQAERNAVQRLLRQRAGFVYFFDVCDRKHGITSERI